MNQRPKIELIKEVATIKGLDPAFVEKDWYVTQVISAVADTEVFFTGGTSLSKAHGLLQRFSEDIDFRIKEQNRRKRRAFRESFIERLNEQGFSIKSEDVTSQNQSKECVITYKYESYFPVSEALRPYIKIEIYAADPQCESIEKPVSSIINATAKKSAEVSRVNCIDPVEIAADKLSALSWRIPSRDRGEEATSNPTLVRHIHDLAILKKLVLPISDFSTLVHRAHTHNDSSRRRSLSDTSLLDLLSLMLKILDTDTEYRSEYERFVGGVSYAPIETRPSFENAKQSLYELVKLIK